MPKLKRQILDVNVEIVLKRRNYKGKQRNESKIFRLVAILNEETGEYNTYLANISSDVLEVEDIAILTLPVSRRIYNIVRSINGDKLKVRYTQLR